MLHSARALRDRAEALQFVVLALVAQGCSWQAPLGDASGWPGRPRPSPGPADGTPSVPAAWRSWAWPWPAYVAWGLPAAVDRLRSGGWPLALEVLSLSIAGTVLWSECVTSPPLRPTRHEAGAHCVLRTQYVHHLGPRVPRGNVKRGFVLAGHGFTAGRGIPPIVDHRSPLGSTWAPAGVLLVPLIFWNLMQWLRSEEHP